MPTAPRDSVRPDASFAPGAADALSHSLRTPLEALRASMEALSREYDELDPRARIVGGALEEVLRLGRNVENLVDFATEPRVQALWCSTREILLSARSRLDVGARESVLVASDGPVHELFVDGPLLARCLERLIDNALEAGSDTVLLYCEASEAGTVFSVVSRGADFDSTEARRAFRGHKSSHLGLGLTLAERDVALLGGALEHEHTPLGDVCARVRLERDAAPEREAA